MMQVCCVLHGRKISQGGDSSHVLVDTR
ncbi:hypothetical protein LINPERHAP1_LOCUS26467 [Linum perenne]